MKLFNETENKYYDVISYLLDGTEAYSENEIHQILEKRLIGEADFEVIDALFSTEEGQEVAFKYEDGKYLPVIKGKMQVRNTTNELQAAKSLVSNQYAKHFLSNETTNKLSDVTNNIESDWNIKDIVIKNQYKFGSTQEERNYEKELSIIASGIQEHKSIVYDNKKSGVYEYIDAEVFPIKIEYSVVNDQFRICAYDEKEDRFIKMNLVSMSNIRKGKRVLETIESEYEEFLKSNTKKIILDVDPIDHVIERCFRIFSFYDRKAVFDKDANKYKLEISYLKFDENEVIRDILSLGSNVVVMEPKRIQKEVLKRIKAASMQYR